MLGYHLYIYASCISFIFGTVVVCSYTIFTRTTPWRKSQFLMWAFRLVCVNTLFSIVALFWNFMALRLFDGAELDLACRAYLPFPIFFFLCGYGCNIFIACRFTSNPGSIESNIVSKAPIYTVWLICFVMVLPIVVLNSSRAYMVSDVLDYDSSLADKGAYCMFNPHMRRAQLVNNLCFQIPLVLTIVINLVAYVKGLHALRDAPQSVVSREMRRAGVYMSVLLLVWIPNFTVNILAELHLGLDLDIAMEIIVMLTGLQGFFNSVVFLWGYPKYRKWLHAKLLVLFCSCCLDPYDKYDYKMKRRNELRDSEAAEPLLNNDDRASGQSLLSPNHSSNESCDIQLRKDALRVSASLASTASIRSSLSKSCRSSTLSGRETASSGGQTSDYDLLLDPDGLEDSLPGRRMSTVDKIVRFSSSDTLYYDKDEPVSPGFVPPDFRANAEGTRTRSIDVRIDMTEEGLEQGDSEGSNTSEEDMGGHSLHNESALRGASEVEEVSDSPIDIESGIRSEDSGAPCTSEPVFNPVNKSLSCEEEPAGTMKRSVSVDHALHHHEILYPASGHSNEVSHPASLHSILRIPEPKPHFGLHIPHSKHASGAKATLIGPNASTGEIADDDSGVVTANTARNSKHHHLHYYEKPLYQMKLAQERRRRDTLERMHNTKSKSAPNSSGGRRRSNSADLTVKPSASQAFLYARLY